MTVRFGVVATAIVLCGAVLAWAALSPEIVLRIEPHGISSRGGHAFVWQVVAPAYLPAAVIAGDDVGNPQSSGLQVYEQELAKNTTERERVTQEFGADIGRFKELKGIK